LCGLDSDSVNAQNYAINRARDGIDGTACPHSRDILLQAGRLSTAHKDDCISLKLSSVPPLAIKHVASNLRGTSTCDSLRHWTNTHGIEDLCLDDRQVSVRRREQTIISPELGSRTATDIKDATPAVDLVFGCHQRSVNAVKKRPFANSMEVKSNYSANQGLLGMVRRGRKAGARQSVVMIQPGCIRLDPSPTAAERKVPRQLWPSRHVLLADSTPSHPMRSAAAVDS
jgi:hypothetical protein